MTESVKKPAATAEKFLSKCWHAYVTECRKVQKNSTSLRLDIGDLARPIRQAFTRDIRRAHMFWGYSDINSAVHQIGFSYVSDEGIPSASCIRNRLSSEIMDLKNAEARKKYEANQKATL